jgi:hypothetical protein
MRQLSNSKAFQAKQLGFAVLGEKGNFKCELSDEEYDLIVKKNNQERYKRKFQFVSLHAY